MSDNTWDMWDGNNYIRKLADKYGIERSQPTYSKSIEIMKAQEEALSSARVDGYREALDDVAEFFKIHVAIYNNGGIKSDISNYTATEVIGIMENMKSAYEKGSEGNGKATE